MKKGTEKIGEFIFESLQTELMRARSETDTNPTDGQKEAGNYKKGRVSIHGFSITIENPKGSYRSGKDKNGKPWKTLMHNDYGYFTRTLGKDGDAVDVFIGPNLNSDKIFPIDQYVGGKFDETKVMLGFNSAEEAKRAYLSNYEKDWKGFKYITEVSVDEFKDWLYNGRKQRKAFAKYVDMKKNVVKINESALRKIISEAISEIGNTPEGRATLARAAEKAHSLGRNGQLNTFTNGLQQAVANHYGEGATASYFDYTSYKYKVRLFFDGRITISNIDGSNKGQENLEDFISNQWNGLKTKDRGVARRISRWCSEYLDKKLPCYEQCLDWHTWALQ